MAGLNDTAISGNDHDNAWYSVWATVSKVIIRKNKGVLHPYTRVNFFCSLNGANHTPFKTKAVSTTLNACSSHNNSGMAIGGGYVIIDKVKTYS